MLIILGVTVFVSALGWLAYHGYQEDKYAAEQAQLKAQEAFDALALPDCRDPRWKFGDHGYMLGPIGVSYTDSRHGFAFEDTTVTVNGIKIFPFENTKFATPVIKKFFFAVHEAQKQYQLTEARDQLAKFNMSLQTDLRGRMPYLKEIK